MEIYNPTIVIAFVVDEGVGVTDVGANKVPSSSLPRWSKIQGDFTQKVSYLIMTVRLEMEAHH